jgi:hypothetical protein
LGAKKVVVGACKAVAVVAGSDFAVRQIGSESSRHICKGPALEEIDFDEEIEGGVASSAFRVV